MAFGLATTVNAAPGDGALPLAQPAAGQIMPGGLGRGVPLRDSFDPDQKVPGHKIIEHGVNRDELMPIYGPESLPVNGYQESHTYVAPLDIKNGDLIRTKSGKADQKAPDSTAPEASPLHWPVPKNVAPRKMAYPFNNEDWK